jgi:hypothetical protein
LFYLRFSVSLLYQISLVYGEDDFSYQVVKGEKKTYQLEEFKRNMGLGDEIGNIIPYMDNFYRILPGSNVTVEIIKLESENNLTLVEKWNTTGELINLDPEKNSALIEMVNTSNLSESIELPPYSTNGNCIIGFSTHVDCAILENWIDDIKNWPDRNDWSYVIPTINQKDYWERFVVEQSLSEENQTIEYSFNDDILIRKENRKGTLFNIYFEEYIQKEYNWKTGWLNYINYTRFFNNVFGNWTPNIAFVLSSLDQNIVTQIKGFEIFSLSLSVTILVLIIHLKRKKIK